MIYSPLRVLLFLSVIFEILFIALLGLAVILLFCSCVSSMCRKRKKAHGPCDPPPLSLGEYGNGDGDITTLHSVTTTENWGHRDDDDFNDGMKDQNFHNEGPPPLPPPEDPQRRSTSRVTRSYSRSRSKSKGILMEPHFEHFGYEEDGTQGNTGTDGAARRSLSRRSTIRQSRRSTIRQSRLHEDTPRPSEDHPITDMRRSTHIPHSQARAQDHIRRSTMRSVRKSRYDDVDPNHDGHLAHRASRPGGHSFLSRRSTRRSRRFTEAPGEASAPAKRSTFKNRMSRYMRRSERRSVQFDQPGPAPGATGGVSEPPPQPEP